MKIMITKDYISEIMHTVITLQNDNQIFVYLSPHVSQLELAVFVGGWEDETKSLGGLGSVKKSISIRIYYGSKSHLNPKNIKSKVEEFIRKYAK